MRKSEKRGALFFFVAAFFKNDFFYFPVFLPLVPGFGPALVVAGRIKMRSVRRDGLNWRRRGVEATERRVLFLFLESERASENERAAKRSKRPREKAGKNRSLIFLTLFPPAAAPPRASARGRPRPARRAPQRRLFRRGARSGCRNGLRA